MQEKCIELIAAQQGADQEANLYWLGEQLKDIVRGTPGAAELVAADIGQPGMGLADAEKKIKAYADAHKKGSQACVPPHKADEILRTLYGLAARDPAKDPATAAQPAPKAAIRPVNLLDLL